MQIRSIEPPLDANGSVDAGTARNWVLADVVAEVARLLGESRITRQHDASAEALRPSDIGIVVKSNSDAGLYASALRAAGIPAVTSGTDSVLDSPAALHWRLLLQSLLRPSDLRREAVAMGVFGDVDVSQVDDVESEDEAALLSRQQQRVQALAVGGVAHLLAALRQDGYQQRALARVGGERCSPTLSTSVTSASKHPRSFMQPYSGCGSVPRVARELL